jgi:uncharacterized circularly permuted ATP-grasp superfamily protein
VLLTDGENNSAYYEHQTLARLLGVPLVLAEMLERGGDELFLRVDGTRVRVDVVYRRTDADRISTPEGGIEPLAELLLEPWRRGRLSVVNAFGTGVADDKRIHGHVEDMIRFYLGEEPLLRSVATMDLSDRGVLTDALGRLDELVIKPRDGHGGHGVVIGPLASQRELRRVRADVREDPGAYVTQEFVTLSEHPTVCDGELAPRHVDLRPFVLNVDGEMEVVLGGLSRVALDEGSVVVNSSQNGGAKDTWILSR